MSKGTFLSTTRRPAPNREPVMVHPEHVLEAQAKLAQGKARHGTPPNMVVILFDDVGWGDFGVYGGWEAVGAPTAAIGPMMR